MGLAPLLVETIFEIIQRLNKDGVTILLVEQNALAALSVAARGYVMQTGEIVLAARPMPCAKTRWYARCIWDRAT